MSPAHYKILECLQTIGPMTATELADFNSMTRRYVLYILAQLMGEKLPQRRQLERQIRICDWPMMKWSKMSRRVPLYAVGIGRDAAKPPPTERAQRNRDWRAKKALARKTVGRVPNSVFNIAAC